MKAGWRQMAHALTAYAGRMLPKERAQWGEAMMQELAHIEDDRAALVWAAGCVVATYRERIRAMMSVNRLSAIAPIGMSLLATLLVLVSVATGWEQGQKDEGAAAHIFQLLIIGQLPLIAAFLFTSNWRRASAVALPMALQLGGLVVALGSVAFFRL